jgi:Holliday junction resolvase RusA-like endonuclease
MYKISDFEIVPKGRPRGRIAYKNGKPYVLMYTDAKTKQNQEDLRKILKFMVDEPITEGVIYIRLIFGFTKKHSKRSGDLDNYVKQFLDAANGIIYDDDYRIVTIDASKLHEQSSNYVDFYIGRLDA